MAGAGYKLFNTGDVLTAAQVNTYLMEQTVMVFASAAARTTALSGVLAEGMVSYLQDTNTLEVYNGSAWVGATGDITEVQAGTGISVASGTGPVPVVTNTVATTFDAKGDLVVGTGADTFAKLVVGNSGESIVADSSASTGLRWQGDWNTGKNKIINGAMDFWQRGTSFSNPKGVFTADRYAYNYDGTGNITLSQQTFTPGAAPVAGYEGQFFLRVNQTTAGSGTTFSVLQQPIEDVRTLANQVITVSFWAKADASRNVFISARQDFGSGGSSPVDTSGATVSLTTSWVRYTSSFTLPSISGKTIGTGNSLRLFLNMPVNTTFTIDIWGVQVESGSVATPFTRAAGTLAGELAACQRYYWRSTTSTAGSHGMGATQSTTSAIIGVNLPVTMRVVPTSIDYANLRLVNYGVAAYTITSITLSSTETTQNFLNMDCAGATGMTANRPVFLYGTGSNGYLGASAEL